ncbi:hypothetical protein WJU23_20580 [Prosthecobacter sp. SYSU 5D2]|uniref:hypothetical protein n=1 Tax=Prosthecobacter sp. SYSU 5D2 TaxID=3134134 RepID=UPI0031FE5F5E
MSAPATQRLPDDHPAWKDLRPFGYECSRWLAAMAMLQARHRKGRFSETITAFLNEWMPQEPISHELPEAFEITFEQSTLHSDGPLTSVTSPLWHAMLHLPALRDFWTAELRASHYTHLLQMIPPAWCMDPAPLPPGTVIAGLDITSWAELPRLEASGRQFRKQTMAENKVVLSAVSAIDASWRARYTRRDGQIVLQDAFLA